MSAFPEIIAAISELGESVLSIDMETGRVRTVSKAEMGREMNTPSDAPRVFKVVLSDGISTKDGCA